MKHLLRVLSVGLLAMVLVACSNTADVKPGTDAANKSDLTVEEVFKKAQEASDSIDSMQIDMMMKQNMKSDAIGIDMDTDIKVMMEMVHEPMSLHQVMEVGISEGEMESLETELYMIDEGLYMKEPMTDNWINLPPEMFGEVSASMGVRKDPSVNLATLEGFIADFKFEQNDEQYILNLSGSGDKFKDLMLEELESTGITAGMGKDETEVLENMVIHQLDYELFIDKNTFQTTAFNLSMDLEIGEEGEQIRIAQNIEANLSRINEIEKIEVPTEVTESAVQQ